MTERLTPRDILDRLVSFPSVSRDSNIPLIDWIAEYLSAHGITSGRYVDPGGEKHALFAQVGPNEPGAIVLSGHTDVVPVDGQNWSTDPWRVHEADGQLFGRGTCDMKGFDALAIWTLVEAHHAGISRPLQIALSFDEEVGCVGAPPLIDAMAASLPKGDTVIVGEPTMMKTVTGHKGGQGFHVHVQGFEVHSSIMHQGVNAIMQGARLIDWANIKNAENAARPPSPLAEAFEPPYTTLHVGQIEGGTAHNITAKDCRFGMDFRIVPGEPVDRWLEDFRTEAARIEAEMQAVRPETGIALKPMFGVPALRPETDGAAEHLTRQLTGDNGSHVVSYGTEAGHFQNAGYSVVVCGPGDIAQAHQPDEFLSLQQLHECQKFMTRLLDHLKCGGCGSVPPCHLRQTDQVLVSPVEEEFYAHSKSIR